MNQMQERCSKPAKKRQRIPIKRRLIANALAFLTAAVCTAVLPAMPTTYSVSAADTSENSFTTSNLKYSIIPGTNEYTITGCTEGTTTVNIPSQINGLPVTNIMASAFAWNTQIVAVNIANGVHFIGAEAFKGCKSLTSIRLPESVGRIGDDAFRGCESLHSITILNQYCTIPRAQTTITTFLSTGYKGTIYGLPDSTAETYAKRNDCKFQALSAIDAENPMIFELTEDHAEIVSVSKYGVKAEIPVEMDGKPVTVIGCGAFSECSKLDSVEIPESITRIDYGAFCCCSALTFLTILNPECVIDDSAQTICTEWDTFSGTIYGYANSTAQAYAEKYGYAFAVIGNTAKQSGDLNGDSTVNLKDVVLLRRYIAGGWEVPLDEQTADLNKDGTVNLKDAVLLRRYIAGGWNVTL